MKSKEKILILTVGLPRSGKSSWSMKHGAPVVNPDSIRLALHGENYIDNAEPMIWTMTRYMVESLFIAGHNTVILDATNVTLNSRKGWVSKKWGVKYKFFDTPSNVCIERAIACDREYLVDVIVKMANDFEPLTDEEKECLLL